VTLPYEHGAGAFLLEPIVLALVVAPSRAGVFVAIGIVAVFLARQPLRFALRDRMQRKRYPRTAACERSALVLLLVAAFAFACSGIAPLLPLIAALPLAATQLMLDLRNQGRTLTAELCGGLAAGAAATAIALAGGASIALSLTLWALIALRTVPSILYVRTALRGESRTAMLVAHAAAVIAASLLTPLAALAMLVLFARAWIPTDGVRAKDIGIREVAYGVLVVALLAYSLSQKLDAGSSTDADRISGTRNIADACSARSRSFTTMTASIPCSASSIARNATSNRTRA
jgi:hypothetical protein